MPWQEYSKVDERLRVTSGTVACALGACGGESSSPPLPDPAAAQPAGPWPDTITVGNPLRLPATLPAQRVPIGTPGELKPNASVLPDGEILLVDYGGQMNPDGTCQENLYLYRSANEQACRERPTTNQRLDNELAPEGRLAALRGHPQQIDFRSAACLQLSPRPQRLAVRFIRCPPVIGPRKA